MASADRLASSNASPGERGGGRTCMLSSSAATFARLAKGRALGHQQPSGSLDGKARLVGFS